MRQPNNCKGIHPLIRTRFSKPAARVIASLRPPRLLFKASSPLQELCRPTFQSLATYAPAPSLTSRTILDFPHGRFRPLRSIPIYWESPQQFWTNCTLKILALADQAKPSNDANSTDAKLLPLCLDDTSLMIYSNFVNLL